MRISTEDVMETYKDHIFAAAFNICKNAADADDIVQETMLAYHISDKEFEDAEHIRAWVLRVAINKAKNINHSFWRRNKVPLEEYMETLCFPEQEAEQLFEEVMHLPEKYRIVLHLFYYEDYSVKEIAGILRQSESNIKVRLSRGRRMLANVWKEDVDE